MVVTTAHSIWVYRTQQKVETQYKEWGRNSKPQSVQSFRETKKGKILHDNHKDWLR